MREVGVLERLHQDADGAVLRERPQRAADADHRRPVVARSTRALDDRACVAGVRDRHRDVAGSQHGRRDELLVTVRVRDAGDAEERKLLLGVLADDARGPVAIELDPSGTGEQIDGLADCAEVEGAAGPIQAAHGVVEQLAGHLFGRVTGADGGMGGWNAESQALCQLKLEGLEALAPDGRAKPHHGGVAHRGRARRDGDTGLDRPGGVPQHDFSHPPLGPTQRGQPLLDDLEEIRAASAAERCDRGGLLRFRPRLSRPPGEARSPVRPNRA